MIGAALLQPTARLRAKSCPVPNQYGGHDRGRHPTEPPHGPIDPVPHFGPHHRRSLRPRAAHFDNLNQQRALDRPEQARTTPHKRTLLVAHTGIGIPGGGPKCHRHPQPAPLHPRVTTSADPSPAHGDTDAAVDGEPPCRGPQTVHPEVQTRTEFSRYAVPHQASLDHDRPLHTGRRLTLIPRPDLGRGRAGGRLRTQKQADREKADQGTPQREDAPSRQEGGDCAAPCQHHDGHEGPTRQTGRTHPDRNPDQQADRRRHSGMRHTPSLCKSDAHRAGVGRSHMVVGRRS